MTQKVSVEELDNRIDELLSRIRGVGDEVILSAGGSPVARLVPIEPAKPALQKRVPGSAKGQFIVPDDFNEPLPDDIVDAFYQ